MFKFFRSRGIVPSCIFPKNWLTVLLQVIFLSVWSNFVSLNEEGYYQKKNLIFEHLDPKDLMPVFQTLVLKLF